MPQLQLPFVEGMDRQLAIDRAAAEKKRHEDWAAALLRSMVERYPPTSEEWDVMLMGIRLARFVSHLECEKCGLDTKDHTVGNLFGGHIKICLKDYYRVRKGEKHEDRGGTQTRNPTPIRACRDKR